MYVSQVDLPHGLDQPAFDSPTSCKSDGSSSASAGVRRVGSPRKNRPLARPIWSRKIGPRRRASEADRGQRTLQRDQINRQVWGDTGNQRAAAVARWANSGEDLRLQMWGEHGYTGASGGTTVGGRGSDTTESA